MLRDLVICGGVEKVCAHYQKMAAGGERVAGQPIRELITVNGVRVVLRKLRTYSSIR